MTRDDRVLLVADAGEGAGLGHISRSSALARALRSRGIETTCVSLGTVLPIKRQELWWHGEANPAAIPERARHHGVVVVDSYRLASPIIDAIAESSLLVTMHDFGKPHPQAALTIAPGYPEHPGWLAGLRYACVSSRFRKLARRAPRATVENALVTTGGGDPGGRSVELSTAARRALPRSRVQLVRGEHVTASAPAEVEVIGPLDSIADALTDVDLVICSAGVTMLEICAAAIPALAVVLAPNQAPLAAVAARAGAIALADQSAALDRQISALASDTQRRRDLCRAARMAVDGHGAARVAAELEKLLRMGSVRSHPR